MKMKNLVVAEQALPHRRPQRHLQEILIGKARAAAIAGDKVAHRLRHIAEDAVAAAPHARQQQFGMRKIVAHMVEPVWRSEPGVYRRCFTLRQQRVGVTNNKASDARVVHYQKTPQRWVNCLFLRHIDQRDVRLPETLPHMLRHALIQIDATGPAGIKRLRDLNVFNQGFAIARVAAIKAEGDYVLFGPGEIDRFRPLRRKGETLALAETGVCAIERFQAIFCQFILFTHPAAQLRQTIQPGFRCGCAHRGRCLIYFLIDLVRLVVLAKPQQAERIVAQHLHLAGHRAQHLFTAPGGGGVILLCHMLAEARGSMFKTRLHGGGGSG